jgi:hypothetical protein
MVSGWQDSWTFRIVDQDTGAAVPGVPVSVLEDAGHAGGYWVSDGDGLVRIPKHDRARLRLRVGLRNEETIELDARSLPDDPIPLTAPRDLPLSNAPSSAAPASAAHAPPAMQPQPGRLVRFARVAVFPRDRDITEVSDVAHIAAPPPASVDPMSVRYGVMIELDLIWQSLGAQSGDTLYSVSLGPGEEVKLAVSDGRWRKKPDARERSLQIVGKMVGARQLGDGLDAVPLDPCVSSDLPGAAVETVRLLAERTVRMCESLRRRPFGVTELEDGGGGGDGNGMPAGASVRTLRNMRSEGVLTYHFVEPVERYRVMVRTPRLRPALLVPFRLPNIATREVVRRFGHALRRSLLDRALGPDVDRVLAPETPPPAVEQRLYAHIAAHLPYYSATIIAAGDPVERFFALAKLRDPQGRPLTDLIENVVVGRVGNYVVFPLRSVDFTTPEWHSALAAVTAPASGAAQLAQASQEISVTLPVPGVWLRSELFPAKVAAERDASAAETPEAGRVERRKQG